MDQEFVKLLSQMAECELPEGIQTVGQIEQYLYTEQESANQKEPTTQPVSGIQMPAYLREQLIHRSKQADMHPVSTPRRFSKRTELFLYSCKITAAVAASLAIMLTTAITQNQYNLQSQKDTLYETQIPEAKSDIPDTIMNHLSSGSEYITSLLQNFSNNIVNKNTSEKENTKR